MATKILVTGTRRDHDGNNYGFSRFVDEYVDDPDDTGRIYDYKIYDGVVRVFTRGEPDAVVRDYAPGVWEVVEVVAE